MKAIDSGQTKILFNGAGCTWQVYRRGRYAYRDVEDMAGRWTRTERVAITPTISDAQVVQALRAYTHQRDNDGAWRQVRKAV